MGGRIPWTKIAANSWLLFVCIFPQSVHGDEQPIQPNAETQNDTPAIILNIVAAVASIAAIVIFIRSLGSTASKTVCACCRSKNRKFHGIFENNQEIEMINAAPHLDLLDASSAMMDPKSQGIDGKQQNKTTILMGLGFMLAAVFYMFPYHALLQLHFWVGEQLDNRTFAVPLTKAQITPIYNMSLFLPMLLLHVYHGDKYIVRFMRNCFKTLDASELKVIAGSIFFLVCMGTSLYLSQVSLTTTMVIVMVPTTLLFSFSEGLIEPTIFGMAGRWSEQAVDWVQTGVGVCGVIVPTIDWMLMKSAKDEESEPVSLSISSEYKEDVLSTKLLKWFKVEFKFSENLWRASQVIPDGTIFANVKNSVQNDGRFSEFFIHPYNKNDLVMQSNMQILCWTGITVGILLVALYYILRRMAVDGDGDGSVKGNTDKNLTKEADDTDEWMWEEIGPSVWAQCLNFAFSLMVWPSVYFLVKYTPEDGKNSSLDTWLLKKNVEGNFELDFATLKPAVMLCFNIFDFFGRSCVVVFGRTCPELLNTITPSQQLTIAWLRVVLPISVHVLLRTETNNRMTIGLIILAFTSFTNGFCGSVSMRSAAVLAKKKMGHLKPDVRAKKVAVMMHRLVSALFVGLGVGSSVHYLLAQIPMASNSRNALRLI